MIKKLLALLLVLLMVVPMIASCGDKKDTTKTPVATNKKEDSELEEDPLVPVIEEYVDELAAENNFDGKTFTWMGPGGWQSPGKDGEVVDEEIGDIQSDAMYYRQRDIEEKFGVDWINVIPEALDDESGLSPAIEALKQDVLAGNGAYDGSYGFQMHTQVLLINGCLLNMEDFTAIDLEREWWPEGMQDTYTVNGAVYFLTGPIVTSYYQDTYCVLFNKQVAEDYGIEEPYDLVKSGEWTFDKMFELASAIPENANGSGAYRYADPDGVATVVAHGESIVKINENGTPYLEETLSLELSNIADKFSKIYSDDTQTVHIKTGEDFTEKYGYENVQEMFAKDGALFLFIPTDEAAWLRMKDVEFGILPMPKGSVEQKDYVSHATSRSVFNVYAPKSIKNEKMTDVIFEAMAALGYKYYKPVFYENLLKGRSTFDKASKDMIDIIFNTKKYDLIGVLDRGANTSKSGEIETLFTECVEFSSESFVSRYFLNAKMVSANMLTILASIEADR